MSVPFWKAVLPDGVSPLPGKQPIVAYMIGFLTAAVVALGMPVMCLADEVLFGRVTKIYRANGKIGVQLLENGNIGTSGAVVDLDILDGIPLDQVEPGDQLKFSIEQIGGVWTITAFQRR
jgi:hypothetical protein